MLNSRPGAMPLDFARQMPEMYKSFVEQKSAFDGAVRNRLLEDQGALMLPGRRSVLRDLSFDILKKSLIELTGAKLGHPKRAVIDALMQCLSQWSQYKSVGLPQNMFPSSLWVVYLHSLDSLMLREGYDSHRYMDDVPIVTGSEAEARRVLRMAIRHLRALELSVNGKKTRMSGPVRPSGPTLPHHQTPNSEDRGYCKDERMSPNFRSVSVA